MLPSFGFPFQAYFFPRCFRFCLAASESTVSCTSFLCQSVFHVSGTFFGGLYGCRRVIHQNAGSISNRCYQMQDFQRNALFSNNRTQRNGELYTTHYPIWSREISKNRRCLFRFRRLSKQCRKMKQIIGKRDKSRENRKDIQCKIDRPEGTFISCKTNSESQGGFNG